jgi:hypothetical protein
MFDALRKVYDRSAAPRASQGAIPTTSTAPRPPEPSLVISVTFGENHDEAIARERQRVREIAESLTVYVEPSKE